MQTKLKGLRSEHGLTQADLAKLLGITRQTYAEKENGNQPFKADELFAISTYFDKPIEDDGQIGRIVNIRNFLFMVYLSY